MDITDWLRKYISYLYLTDKLNLPLWYKCIAISEHVILFQQRKENKDVLTVLPVNTTAKVLAITAKSLSSTDQFEVLIALVINYNQTEALIAIKGWLCDAKLGTSYIASVYVKYCFGYILI